MKALLLLLVAFSACPGEEPAAGKRAELGKLDTHISDLEAKLVKLAEPLRARCVDDIPILQRMIEQTKKGMEQAGKVGDQTKARELKQKHDEMVKVVEQQEALSISDKDLEKLIGEINRVKQEIADANAQRERLRLLKGQ